MDGERRVGRWDSAARTLLSSVVGEAGDGWVELRFRQPGGRWSRQFFAATEPDPAAAFAVRYGESIDIYAGTALRARQGGERGRVQGVDRVRRLR